MTEFCPYCDMVVGEEEEWTAVVDPSVSGGKLRAHFVCPPRDPGSAAGEGTTATQILSRPPRRFGEEEETPQRGWAIRGDGQVFKDGALAGQFIAVASSGSRWSLRYDFLGEGLDDKTSRQ
jgi:hypothetical protein